MSSDPTKLRTYLAILMAPGNGAEATLMMLLTERAIDTATGPRLAAIGKLVGQPNSGLDDDDYRRYVRARISTNRSSGALNELYKITRLVLDDAEAVLVGDRQPPAAIVMRVSGAVVDDDLAAILMGFLRDAAASGIRIILEYSAVPPLDVMYFDINTLDNKAMIAAIE